MLMYGTEIDKFANMSEQQIINYLTEKQTENEILIMKQQDNIKVCKSYMKQVVESQGNMQRSIEKFKA